MPRSSALLPMGAVLLLCNAPGLHAQARFQAVTDPRDGYRYRVVTIRRLQWFAENLRFS